MNSVKLTKFYQEAQIEWRIHDILSSPEDARYNSFFVSQTFSFAETTWRLLLVSELSEQPEMARFTFMFIEACKYSVKYNFFIKHPDGTLDQLVSGFIENKQKECKTHHVKLKEILQLRPECASSDVTVILGSLKAGNFSEASMSGEPKSKKLRKLDTLSQDLHSLFTDQLSSDITLYVKDKKYNVHKTVLMARSTVFAAMFKHDTSEKQTGIINVSDCDPESFGDFLNFLYCGKLEDLTSFKAINLYVISEKYNVQELKIFCREHLIENLELDIWCDVYAMADLHEDKNLLSAAQKFFHKNLLQIFKTSEWEHFMKDKHPLACQLLKEIPDKIMK